jgi:predicted transcriptional regulator of viral defense system
MGDLLVCSGSNALRVGFVKVVVPPKIASVGNTVIQFYERSQLGAFRLVSGSTLRVATIGRVFLDMLREPALCGGIQHVVDIYQREAKRYLKLIVDEVERHGQPIDKVRVGYLLSDVCKLEAPEFSSWQKFAQRGGSRKLDAKGEYVPSYSERWLLSINVPSLTLPEDVDE